MELRIAYLYPDQLNIYGDRGNILTLYQRCQWREIAVQILTPGLGERLDPDQADLYFMGGGQDSQQMQVCQDLHQVKADSIKQAAANGAVFLTICGGYQLLGHYYKPHNGAELKGLSLIDAYTVSGNTRFIGNVAIERPNGQRVVGFENHSGRTYLGPGVTPLGKVLHGHGNNGEDGFEGVAQDNFYGTYQHGSLLPKNPQLADEIIAKALQRRYGPVTLTPLDDQLEQQAQTRALALKS